MFKKEETSRGIPRYEVLLISNDHPTVRLMNSYFNSKQFKLFDVTNCSQAWKELQNHSPMLILLDRSLPDKERKELLKHVKLEKRLKNVPIKIFTKKDYERKSQPKWRKKNQPYRDDIVDYFKF